MTSLDEAKYSNNTLLLQTLTAGAKFRPHTSHYLLASSCQSATSLPVIVSWFTVRGTIMHCPSTLM
ncbi:hypothetical protein OPS25_03605 [Alteromonas ponticola]|uniref:Uncharacterized protein n=1 Tax=Alteromonas aquimaris TaxID=2998417 RepID=A0ABT3P490_9ALTE|nr:hypothetical protein [Alteromonas aquimaris]MCW8107590.1 hypothetical protein [Alteromonas aquimaris]